MYVQVSRFKQYTRVRIVEKVLSDGKWKIRLVEHVGSARTEGELSVLRDTAKKRLESLKPQLNLLRGIENAADSHISRISIAGSHAWGLWTVVGGLYDSIGLPDELLKYMVLARIASPKSKLATARYLESNLGLKISVSAIYK